MKKRSGVFLSTLLFFSTTSFANEEMEMFSGCIGRDVNGREVKVESLSRSLENCPFAKVYLKENEEKYKQALDEKIADALKTSLDQDLETLMLQGEFFNSLGINLLNYGSNEAIKTSCQLDKMTDLSGCSGKNTEEYERRKNTLISKFGAKNGDEFNQKIKDKFKKMTGRDQGSFCSLLNSDEQNSEQFLLYQSSLTKASLLELKQYLEQGISTSDIQAKFPMLDLIFKGDEKIAQKFVEEIKSLDSKKDPNVLANLVKEKITSFYSQKENARSLSETMVKTCGDFNKKIAKFICNDDLSYETQNGATSKRLFDGFDMSQSDLARNKRVKLQDKEMAFMAFGKKCEIDEREESAGLAEKRQNLDQLIGAEGLYAKGLRTRLNSDDEVGLIEKLKEVAFCQIADLKSKKLCAESKVISSKKLRETYNCPDSKSCEDSIELAANYLEGCEKREAKNKRLAENSSTIHTNRHNGSERDLVEDKKDSLDLDFFDNLLSDTKVPSAKSISLNKKSNIVESKISVKDKNASDPYAPKTQKQNEGKKISETSEGRGYNELSNSYSGAEKFTSTNKKAQVQKSLKVDPTSKRANSSLVNNGGATSSGDTVSKINSELRERLASLEKKGAYKDGYEAGLSESGGSQGTQGSQGAKADLLNKASKSSKSDGKVKFNDSVYRNNQDFSDQEDFSEAINDGGQSTVVSKAKEGADIKDTGKVIGGSKGQAIGLNTQSTKKDEGQESVEPSPGLVLGLDELSLIDEAKLNQFWKNKNAKFIIGVKDDKEQNEKIILSLDKNKKPTIENFQSLSLKARESVLKSKLFKDYKVIRQVELNATIKSAL